MPWLVVCPLILLLSWPLWGLSQTGCAPGMALLTAWRGQAKVVGVVGVILGQSLLIFALWLGVMTLLSV